MQTHRFRDAAGISLKGKGETRYMTADEAEKLGKALLAIAESIRSEPFINSAGLTVEFTTAETAHGIKSDREARASELEAEARAICEAAPGYGSHNYRGDPYEAVALRQQAERMRGDMPPRSPA